MVEAVQAFGGVASCFPLIDIVPRVTDALLAAVSEAVDAVVLTSANAVDAYVAGRAQADLHEHGPPVFCVGSQTAQRAAQAGLIVEATPRVAAAEYLPDLLDKWNKIPGRVLLVQGNRASSVLADQLRAQGWHVVTAVGYDTRTSPQAQACLQAVLQNEIDVLTFASGSAVQALVDAMNAAGVTGEAVRRRVVIASIGPKTTNVLRLADLEPHVTAEAASGHALIQAIFAYLGVRE